MGLLLEIVGLRWFRLVGSRHGGWYGVADHHMFGLFSGGGNSVGLGVHG